MVENQNSSYRPAESPARLVQLISMWWPQISVAKTVGRCWKHNEINKYWRAELCWTMLCWARAQLPVWSVALGIHFLQEFVVSWEVYTSAHRLLRLWPLVIWLRHPRWSNSCTDQWSQPMPDIKSSRLVRTCEHNLWSPCRNAVLHTYSRLSCRTALRRGGQTSWVVLCPMLWKCRNWDLASANMVAQGWRPLGKASCTVVVSEIQLTKLIPWCDPPLPLSWVTLENRESVKVKLRQSSQDATNMDSMQTTAVRLRVITPQAPQGLFICSGPLQSCPLLKAVVVRMGWVRLFMGEAKLQQEECLLRVVRSFLSMSTKALTNVMHCRE